MSVQKRRSNEGCCLPAATEVLYQTIAEVVNSQTQSNPELAIALSKAEWVSGSNISSL